MTKKQNKRTMKKKNSSKNADFSAFVNKVKNSMKWFLGLFAGVALTVGLIFTVVWLIGLDTNNVLPLNRLEVSGQQYTKGEELYSSLQKIKDRGFFSMDMELAEKELMNLPWVKKVQLRKVWPETLNLTIEEHKPLAFWGFEGVVSNLGEVFYPQQLPEASWVTLSGPDGLATELTELLQNYQQQLDQKKISIISMSLSERGSVNLEIENKELGDNLMVKLGKYQVSERLQRFIEQIDTVKSYKDLPLNYVDLRYQNGLVAAWRKNSTGDGTGNTKVAQLLLNGNDNSSR